MSDETTEQVLQLSDQDREYAEALHAKCEHYTQRGKNAEAHGVRVALAYFRLSRIGQPLYVEKLPPTGFGDLDIPL